MHIYTIYCQDDFSKYSVLQNKEYHHYVIRMDGDHNTYSRQNSTIVVNRHDRKILIILDQESHQIKLIEVPKDFIEEPDMIFLKEYLDTRVLFDDDDDDRPLEIKTSLSIFDQLLYVMDFGFNTTNFSVSFLDENKMSYGDGAKREIFSRALNEFAEKYLIYDGHYPAWNFKELEKIEHRLATVGTLLSHIMIFTRGHLSIRLPLQTLYSFAPHFFEDLEYFAKIQNPEVYQTIQQNRGSISPSEYSDAIKNLCRIDETKQNMVNKIALSFLRHNHYCVTDGVFPNMVSADYYLHGPLKIDRKRLLKRTIINSDQEDLFEILEAIIEKCSEDQLKNLLRNWSGNSSVCDFNYNIDLINGKTFKFCTCACSLIIPIEIWKMERVPDLIEYLTTPLQEIIN